MRIAAGLLGLGPIKDEEVEIGHLPFISSKTGRQDQLSVLAVEKKAVPQLVIEALLIVMGFLKRPNLSETDLFILSAGEANQAFIYECLASIDCGSFRTFDSATIQNN